MELLVCIFLLFVLLETIAIYLVIGVDLQDNQKASVTDDQRSVRSPRCFVNKNLICFNLPAELQAPSSKDLSPVLKLSCKYKKYADSELPKDQCDLDYSNKRIKRIDAEFNVIVELSDQNDHGYDMLVHPFIVQSKGQPLNIRIVFLQLKNHLTTTRDMASAKTRPKTIHLTKLFGAKNPNEELLLNLKYLFVENLILDYEFASPANLKNLMNYTYNQTYDAIVLTTGLHSEFLHPEDLSPFLAIYTLISTGFSIQTTIKVSLAPGSNIKYGFYIHQSGPVDPATRAPVFLISSGIPLFSSAYMEDPSNPSGATKLPKVTVSFYNCSPNVELSRIFETKDNISHSIRFELDVDDYIREASNNKQNPLVAMDNLEVIEKGQKEDFIQVYHHKNHLSLDNRLSDALDCSTRLLCSFIERVSKQLYSMNGTTEGMEKLKSIITNQPNQLPIVKIRAKCEFCWMPAISNDESIIYCLIKDIRLFDLDEFVRKPPEVVRGCNFPFVFYERLIPEIRMGKFVGPIYLNEEGDSAGGGRLNYLPNKRTLIATLAVLTILFLVSTIGLVVLIYRSLSTPNVAPAKALGDRFKRYN